MAEEMGMVVQLVTQGEVESNIEALREHIEKLIEDYRDLTVEEKDLAQAKRDRAYLNGLARELDAQRLSVKKQFMQPIDAFEAKVKELLAPIKEASANIDQQVKAFEQKRKDEKRRLIEEHWLEVAGILADVVPFERVWDEKWANVSSSLGEAYDSLANTAKRIAADYETLESLGLAHESAAKAMFLSTLDLSAAIQHAKDLEAKEVAAKQLDEDRDANLAEESVNTVEAESVVVTDIQTGEVINTVTGEVMPDEPRYRWEWVIEGATVSQMRDLAAYGKSIGLSGKATRREKVER